MKNISTKPNPHYTSLLQKAKVTEIVTSNDNELFIKKHPSAACNGYTSVVLLSFSHIHQIKNVDEQRKAKIDFIKKLASDFNGNIDKDTYKQIIDLQFYNTANWYTGSKLRPVASTYCKNHQITYTIINIINGMKNKNISHLYSKINTTRHTTGLIIEIENEYGKLHFINPENKQFDFKYKIRLDLLNNPDALAKELFNNYFSQDNYFRNMLSSTKPLS